ncbi:MAG: DinB family protein [Chloroflexota bacterium]
MNVLDVLKYGHQTVLQTINNLPQTDWDTGGVCGVWSVKDIMAHLASFERLLVDILGTFLGQPSTPYLDRYLEAGPLLFNDTEVARRKEKTVAETLAEYNEQQAQTMKLVARIPAETWRQVSTLPWYGPEYALDDFIVYSYYGHKREHCAQIAVFRDQIGR